MSEFRWLEARALLLGDKIGEGYTRKVYVCRLDQEYVVKVEPAGRAFQNVEEWRAWEWSVGTPKAKWLAPCKFISPCGLLLIQRRVTPMRAGERPRKIPDWLTDLKPENFGHMDGRIVACDYGTILSSFQNRKTTMVKPRWRQ